jgi:nitrogen regulation protein NR(I)
MPRLLVIDDEPNVLYSMEKSLRSETLEVLTARTAKEGLELVRQRQPDTVILDVRLPDMYGLDAFDRIHEIDPRVPVIVITAYAATETAIEAMKRGAFEYLIKPVDFPHLRDLVRRATELSRLSRVPAVFGGTEPSKVPVDRIIGSSAVMQDVYKAIGRVAPQDVTVLLLGESGTGKELVARAIYQHSQRSRAPFLAINCAAIPEPLLESELFGHERGAFTGADRRRIGKFEQAHGGTIFLDEIGDMSMSIQSKVLRLLQAQHFERLGGNETIQTDVRVIAATNQNLEKLAAEGRFRQDLFYRLNVFTIRLPPVRERLDDLPALVEHFLKTFSAEFGKPIHGVSPEALQQLERHTWPGNVRELQSTIKYAIVQCAGPVLTPDCFPESIGTRAAAQQASGTDVEGLTRFVRHLLDAGESEIYDKVSRKVDHLVLEEVLRHCRGNQVQASELLGISRTTLRAKLRSLGLSIEKQILAESDQSEQELDKPQH